MRRILSAQTLILTGCIAVALSTLFAALGVALFGREMLPHLLAEVSGVLLEVAIAILIIERITTIQRRREAKFAYDALSNRAAMTFVDVMRLLWIRASASALEYNGGRYGEFRQLAALHLAEYRSNIEGFAGSLDPASHEALRQIDRRLTWAIGRLEEVPNNAVGRLEFKDLMTETADTVANFLRSNDGRGYQEAEASAELALRRAESEATQGTEYSPDGVFRWRLQAQEHFLGDSVRVHPTPRGILFDVDNELALVYFLIDRQLLLRAT